VQGIDLDQQFDIGRGVAPGERLSWGTAPVADPAVPEVLTDQPGDLSTGEAGDLRDTGSKHTLVQLAERDIAELPEHGFQPRAGILPVGHSELDRTACCRR